MGSAAGSDTAVRVGLGEDSHRTEPGGPLRLGGIDVEHDHQLVGHSDADVLLHAVTDALLGAAGLTDIGRMFPNTEAKNRGRCSAEMLQLAYEQVRQAGFQLLNLDCVVAAERPKLSPHAEQICSSIAKSLEADVSQIGFKAKTGEGVGPVGRGELIEARCVVLLQKTPNS